MSTPRLDLGDYRRAHVTNARAGGAAAFDQGLRLLLAYQHESAAERFRASARLAPDCALAHALVAYCHGPNYNFRGRAYYETSRPDGNGEGEGRADGDAGDRFPCQRVADRHSRLAVETVERLERMPPGDRGACDEPQSIQNAEIALINAIRLLTCQPGLEFPAAERAKDVPFAEAMAEAHAKHPDDAEIAYVYVSAVMTLHAWRLFDYPTGAPLSEDVPRIQWELEGALGRHPRHAGLCHLHVHLCEMSADPAAAAASADVLRTACPEAGHLLHMPTHLDVLAGDYAAVVRDNARAIAADERAMQASPRTSNPESFYFGYAVHNFHMLVYGCILGAMEGKATETAAALNARVHEGLFRRRPDLAAYLESYAALDVHVLVRFGRWEEILRLAPPADRTLMLYRGATLHFARALAFANTGRADAAEGEVRAHEALRARPGAEERTLHNNTVAALLEVDAAMMHGELAYFTGRRDLAFAELRRAVELQDGLAFDEPWGKAQPVRHTLGGLLLREGQEAEAAAVFREDLARHPRNPWALAGLIACLRRAAAAPGSGPACCDGAPTEAPRLPSEAGGNSVEAERERISVEMETLRRQFNAQRASEWSDYDVTVACACCRDS